MFDILYSFRILEIHPIFFSMPHPCFRLFQKKGTRLMFALIIPSQDKSVFSFSIIDYVFNNSTLFEFFTFGTLAMIIFFIFLLLKTKVNGIYKKETQISSASAK